MWTEELGTQTDYCLPLTARKAGRPKRPSSIISIFPLYQVLSGWQEAEYLGAATHGLPSIPWAGVH